MVRAQSSRGTRDTVTAAVFIPGDRIATASEDGTVRTWVAQLQPPLRPRSLDCPLRAATLDPRATVKGSVVTLRLPSGDVTLTGHRDDVLSVEVSRDGSRVVTASKDGDARIWDARTGESLWVLRGHSGTVFDASFSPNGRWVVTGGPTTAGSGTRRRASACTSCGATEARSARRRSPRRRASSPAETTACAPTCATPAAVSRNCSHWPSGAWLRRDREL